VTLWRQRAERHESHVMSVGRQRLTATHFHDPAGRSMIAAEPHQGGAKDRRIRRPAIELRASGLDLADDHVRCVCRNAERRIGGHDLLVGARTAPFVRQHAAHLRKTKREDVEIGDCAVVGLARLRDDRVLRHGQIAVDANVGLDKRDPDVHALQNR